MVFFFKELADQVNEAKELLPEGEEYDRAYRAYEGDLRIITKDQYGCERRYSVLKDTDGKTYLVRM